MANKTEYSRLRLKRSGITGVIPTIPSGNTIDNTWLSTDLLIGEGFMNAVDDRLWYRTVNGIIEVPLSGFSSANYYTDSAFLSGNTVFFNRTDLPLAYSVDLSPIVGGSNTFVTGGTYSSGTLTLERNDGNTVTITGFTSGSQFTGYTYVTEDTTQETFITEIQNGSNVLHKFILDPNNNDLGTGIYCDDSVNDFGSQIYMDTTTQQFNVFDTNLANYQSFININYFNVLGQEDTRITLETSNLAGSSLSNIILNTDLNTDESTIELTSDTIEIQANDILLDGDVDVTGDTVLKDVTASTISNLNYIDFNDTYTGNTNQVVGRLNWNLDDGTLEVGMGGTGDVTQQIGLEQYYLVKNQTGSQLDNGYVVRADGTLGSSGRILADYMIADGSIPYYYTLGILTQDIANGDDGYVTHFGLVRGINTTGSLFSETWVDGDILYVSPTILGGLTNVEPNEPDLKIQMAIVINAASNGSLFVRPDLGSKLGDLHDLQTSGATNGDLIAFDSSDNIWKYTKELNGNYEVVGSLSATTFYGNGSNLTGIPNTFTTGATLSGNTIVFNRTDLSNAYSVDLSSITPPTPDLATVLTEGNTTGGNDIVISTGDKISDTTGDNIIEFTNVIPEGGVISTSSTPANPGAGASYFISPNSTNGSGTGLQVRMNRNTSDNSFGIQESGGNQIITQRGSGYEVGDTITFLGTQYGLSSPANDVTYTILSVTDEFNKINISSTDGTDTSEIDMSNFSINFNVGDGNNYSSFYGNKVGIGIGTYDDVNSLYEGLEFDPTLSNVGTRFYSEDLNTELISSLELDPNGNNNGTRFYSEDINSGDKSEIKIEPTTINFTSNQVDFSNVTTIIGLPNDYTTGATLNGTVIEFDRTDLSNAYSVDIKPALLDYLPLNITGNTTVSISNTSNLYITGDSTTQIYNYVEHDTDRATGNYVSPGGSVLFSIDTSENDGYYIESDYADGAYMLYNSGSTVINRLRVTKSTIQAYSISPTFNGITYNSDFSTNYTNRSLVDKEYVDTAISGISTTDNYVTGGTFSANTLTLNRQNGDVSITGITKDVPYDISFAISDETTAITVGTNKLTFYAPRAFTITKVVATLSQSGSTSSDFDVNKNGSTIFTRRPTIDANEFHSDDASAGVPILSTTSVLYKDKITIDIDSAGTGAAGAKIYIIGKITV